MDISIYDMLYTLYIYISLSLSFIIIKNLIIYRKRMLTLGPWLYFGSEMIGTIAVFLIKYADNIEFATLVYNLTLPQFVIGATGINMLVFTYVLKYKNYKFWQKVIFYITTLMTIISYLYIALIDINPFLVNPHYKYYDGIVVFSYDKLTMAGFLVQGMNFIIVFIILIVMGSNYKKIKNFNLKFFKSIVSLFALFFCTAILLASIFDKIKFFNIFEIGLLSMVGLKFFVVFNPKDKNILDYKFIDRFYIMDHLGIIIIIIGQAGKLLDINIEGKNFLKKLKIDKSNFNNLKNAFNEKIEDFDFDENIGNERYYQVEFNDKESFIAITIQKISAIVKSDFEETENYILIGQDVTQTRKQKLAMKSYYSIFEAIGSGVIIFDDSNQIIEVNNIAVKLTEYNATDLIGNNISILNKKGDINGLDLKVLEEIALYDYWRGYVIINRKDSPPTWMYVSVNTIVDEFTGLANYVMVLSEASAEFIDLQWQADYDPLTGVYNRNGILKNACQLIFDKNQEVSFMMLDLDDFKKVNDKYGHLKGDEVLKDFARLCLGCVGKKGLVGRYGGEEFLIILGQKGIEALSQEIAQDILEKVRKLEFDHEGEKFGIRCSIGIAIKRKDEDNLSLIKRADEMLYQAKETGKDKYIID